MLEVRCPICHKNSVPDNLPSEPRNTCLECIEFYDERIAIAEAEKYKTEGDVLRNGLFGSDDCRLIRGMGIITRKRATPILAIDIRKGRHSYTKEILGRPRTGRVLVR